jgi:hypothetical protein
MNNLVDLYLTLGVINCIVIGILVITIAIIYKIFKKPENVRLWTNLT